MEDQILEQTTADQQPDQGLINQDSRYDILAFHNSHLFDPYRNMVISKWLRSLRFGNEYFRLITPEGYWRPYKRYLEELINKSIIRVAVLSDDSDVALGFSVTENTTLHYVFVHADFINSGIASSLIPKECDQISHITKNWMRVMDRKYKFKFNPLGAPL